MGNERTHYVNLARGLPIGNRRLSQYVERKVRHVPRKWAGPFLDTKRSRAVVEAVFIDEYHREQCQ